MSGDGAYFADALASLEAKLAGLKRTYDATAEADDLDARERYVAQHGTVTLPAGTNFLERKAAEYMADHFADGLRHFGVTPESVAEIARARLNALGSEAQAVETKPSVVSVP